MDYLALMQEMVTIEWYSGKQSVKNMTVPKDQQNASISTFHGRHLYITSLNNFLYCNKETGGMYFFVYWHL